MQQGLDATALGVWRTRGGHLGSLGIRGRCRRTIKYPKPPPPLQRSGRLGVVQVLLEY